MFIREDIQKDPAAAPSANTVSMKDGLAATMSSTAYSNILNMLIIGKE